MTGSDYDVRRFYRWYNNPEFAIRFYKIRHIRLVPGKGPVARSSPSARDISGSST